MNRTVNLGTCERCGLTMKKTVLSVDPSVETGVFRWFFWVNTMQFLEAIAGGKEGNEFFGIRCTGV